MKKTVHSSALFWIILLVSRVLMSSKAQRMLIFAPSVITSHVRNAIIYIISNIETKLNAWTAKTMNMENQRENFHSTKWWILANSISLAPKRLVKGSFLTILSTSNIWWATLNKPCIGAAGNVKPLKRNINIPVCSRIMLLTSGNSKKITANTGETS